MVEEPNKPPDPELQISDEPTKGTDTETSRTPTINSPATPVIGRRGSSPSNRDYKALYHELKQNTAIYTDKTEEKLAAHREEINELKRSFESAISRKDEEIAALQQKIKAPILSSLKRGDEEIFQTKAKKKKCQFCDREDALIKCNACGLWICELCSEIPISKLKPIMNKCNTVYIACKECGESINNGCENEDMTTGVIQKVSTLSEQLSILQTNEAALRNLLQERENELDEAHLKLNAVENAPLTESVSRENEQLIREKTRLEKELSTRQAELNKAIEEKRARSRDCLDLTQTITELKKESENSQNTLRAQAGIIQSLQKKNATAAEEKDNDVEIKADNSSKPASLDEKLDSFSEKLLNKVTQIVDEKLSKFSPDPGTSYADITRDKNQTPTLVTNAPDFAKIMRENKNEELVEEKEQQRRANNLIVYGAKEEPGDTTNSQKTRDDNFIAGLMTALDVNVTPTEIVRLGKPNPGKTRPIKLTMSSEMEKKLVMDNLKNLKDAEEAYHTLSVRDDYTLKEREMINKYVQEAKQKNDAENTTEWKVRGTPKNGLRVVRITRR